MRLSDRIKPEAETWKDPTSVLSLRGFCLARRCKGEEDVLLCDFVLDVIAVSSMTDDEKDVEILLLRQQLRIVERKQ
jgi:hypothetical protein